MNARIDYIASNTFREAVRDRVLYNLIAFALLLSGAAILVGQISIDIEKLVVINLGLTAVSLFGVVIAIFIGIGLVSKEIDKRTLYTVLSRPVRRWEFIVGKFFGLAGTLVVNAFFMAIGVFGALLYVAHKFQAPDGMGARGPVLHHPAVPDHLLAGAAVLVVLVAAAVGGVRVLAVRDWDVLRRPAQLCRDGNRHDEVAGYGGGLPGPEFFGAERHQLRGARAAGSCATDCLQHGLCAALRRHGAVRSGADLRAAQSEMNGIAQSHGYGVGAAGRVPGRFHRLLATDRPGTHGRDA